MSTSIDPLEWLVRPFPPDSTIDRKALARLLLDVARNVKPELAAQPIGTQAVDVKMEQLRALLLGREIELLAQLGEVIQDPEQFAAAVRRVLPTAFAQAASDARLAQVMAPALEKAAQNSIRNDPRTLVNILYPLIVPAIRKSIGETIDQTFQSLNESLKHSLTWQGLTWRWEAWRTGVSFAEVVLRHTLIYQVEHVFLIHRHTGLLISHVTTENAASQDPQLVSSMLTAIQDFVRDSFSGAEHQGLDTLRLGELTLWSEPGPFATLVAVIRGRPPEALHETLTSALSQIHAERHHALENFDGDSSGLIDVEAQLRECVTLRQQRPLRVGHGFPWLVAVIVLIPILLASAWGFRRWQDDQLWANYVAQLRAQPGLVITEVGRRDGKFVISGLRDPLALDPQRMLDQSGINPTSISAQWAPYQALAPQIVLKRLQAEFDPPSTVRFTIEGDRILAQGSAPSGWLERVRAAALTLSTGAPGLDLSGVQNVDAGDELRWQNYVTQLRTQPGLVVIDAGRRNGTFQITGLRDPLAVDPQRALGKAGIDPSHVIAHWASYQALDPQIVLKRLQASLNPPSGVELIIEGNRIVAQGSAPSLWLDRARNVSRTLPVGAPALDLSGVQTVSDGAIGKLREAIQSLNIRFDANEALPAPGQDAVLNQLAGELKQLEALSSTLRVTTQVMLTGHADAVGQSTLNVSLSLARAEVVRALLKKRGVDPELLAVRGAGTLEPLTEDRSDAARSANRRVSFTVGIEDQP